MKKWHIVIFISFFIITACSYFQDKGIEVSNESMKIYQSSSFDINSAQMGKKFNEASVQGEIKNVSDKTLTNIVLTYKFPRGKVTAKIRKLAPGKIRKFVTSRYKTVSNRPSFKLDNISFSKQ